MRISLLCLLVFRVQISITTIHRRESLRITPAMSDMGRNGESCSKRTPFSEALSVINDGKANAAV